MFSDVYDTFVSHSLTVSNLLLFCQPSVLLWQVLLVVSMIKCVCHIAWFHCCIAFLSLCVADSCSCDFYSLDSFVHAIMQCVFGIIVPWCMSLLPSISVSYSRTSICICLYYSLSPSISVALPLSPCSTNDSSVNITSHHLSIHLLFFKSSQVTIIVHDIHYS